MDARSQNIVDASMQEFSNLQTYRNVFAAQWEEAAQLIAPEFSNTFYYGSYNFPGMKKTQRQVDATGMLALERFGAILDSMLTPQNAQWHTLRPDNDDLMRSHRVALYFDAVTKILFKNRYTPHANFTSQNQDTFRSLGAFGNGIMVPEKFVSPTGGRGLRYRNNPLGEMFFHENFQGRVDGFVRWFRLTARQARQQFGEDKLPAAIKDCTNPETQFEFIHRVCPREDYDTERLDARGKPYASYFISITGRVLLREGGFNVFPLAITRYSQVNGIEAYGRGPAQRVLPSLKTLNSQKADFLTQGHMAVDPVYLTTDDGIVGWDRRPGALNKGGLDSAGNPLVRTLETGNIQISEKMMEDEKAIIEGGFLVDLFKILLDDPKIYSATQVVEMMSQRGILLAPTIGRQQAEYLGPLVEREIDLLGELGLLPPTPPELQEAAGEYKVVYTSPLARSMRAGDLAGLNRSLERAMTVAQATGDPTPLFYFDWDAIIPEAADIDGVPAHWLASSETVKQMKAQHQQMIQAQQQTQAAPAAAALMKAQAAQKKEGM